MSSLEFRVPVSNPSGLQSQALSTQPPVIAFFILKNYPDRGHSPAVANGVQELSHNGNSVAKLKLQSYNYGQKAKNKVTNRDVGVNCCINA